MLDMARTCSFYIPFLLLTILVSISQALAGQSFQAEKTTLKRQLDGVPSASDFVSRAYHATVQLGNYLYIDGGEIAFLTGNGQANLPDNRTYSIDLTQTWTNATVQFTAINKDAPVLIHHTLWADRIRQNLYAYGGEQSFALPLAQSPPLPSNSLWQFLPDNRGSGIWNELDNTTGFEGIHRVSSANYASGAHSGVMLGGYTSQRSSEEAATALSANDFIPTPGITLFNYTSQTWSNRSATGFSQYGTAQFGQGQVINGFGEYSVFGFFGGDTSNQLLWKDDGSNLLSFDTLYFYDPYADKWYSQKTSGTIPESRDRFCSVSILGDNQTLEIFIFGGHVASSDGTEPQASASQSQKDRNTAMDQVFVLSLPGFNWQQANYPARWPRIGHSCVVPPGNRNMIVVGGRNPAADNLSSLIFTPDPWTNGIGVFDLTAMQWTNQYNPGGKTYVTPKVVKNWYAQNGRYPSQWDSDDVKAYFEQTRSTASPDDGGPQGSNSTGNSTGSVNTGQPTTSHSSSTNVGAIVGGVIGGIAILAIIAVLVWFFCYRRRKPFAELPTSESGGMSLYEKASIRNLIVKNESPTGQVQISELGQLPDYQPYRSSFQELMDSDPRPEMPAQEMRHELP